MKSSNASAYFKAILHFWTAKREYCCEILDISTLSLECTHGDWENPRQPPEESVHEYLVNDLECRGFVENEIGINVNEESVVEVTGKISVIWAADDFGDVDEDVEIEDLSHYLFTKKQMSDYFGNEETEADG